MNDATRPIPPALIATLATLIVPGDRATAINLVRAR